MRSPLGRRGCDRPRRTCGRIPCPIERFRARFFGFEAPVGPTAGSPEDRGRDGAKSATARPRDVSTAWARLRGGGVFENRPSPHEYRTARDRADRGQGRAGLDVDQIPPSGGRVPLGVQPRRDHDRKSGPAARRPRIMVPVKVPLCRSPTAGPATGWTHVPADAVGRRCPGSSFSHSRRLRRPKPVLGFTPAAFDRLAPVGTLPLATS